MGVMGDSLEKVQFFDMHRVSQRVYMGDTIEKV
jgi:hypothetical protein